MADVADRDAVTIPLSRAKSVFLVLLAAGFVALCVWLWVIAESVRRAHPLVVRTVAVLGVGLFGASAMIGIRKCFDSRPGLVIDAEGIIDNASGVSAGRVRWSEIEEISMTRVQRQEFISFIVRDPERFIEGGNFFKRKIAAANLRLYGTPVHISANALKIKKQELVELVQEYYERYARAA